MYALWTLRVVGTVVTMHALLLLLSGREFPLNESAWVPAWLVAEFINDRFSQR